MLNSIRWRIGISFILLMIIVMGVMGVIASNQIEEASIQSAESELAEEARIIANNILGYVEKEDEGIDHQDLTIEWAGIINARVTVIDQNGIVLGDSHEDPLKMGTHIARPEIQNAITTGIGTSIRKSETLGYEMIYACVPIEKDGQVFGYVRTGIPADSVREPVREFQSTFIWLIVLVAGIAFAIAYLVTNQLTNKLTILTENARRIASGVEHERYIPKKQDEIASLAYAIDAISQQVTAQIEEIRGEERKLDAILGQLSDGVMIVDSEGYVVFVNRSAERIFDLGKNQTVGRSLPQVVRHHQIRELWQSNQETGEEQILIMEIPNQKVFIQAIATLLSQDMAGFTLLLFQDLTEMHRLETIRRDFVSNLSHELRTPLASLKALAETLQSGAKEDPEAAGHFIERINIEVDALTNMVEELLELSRIESGRVPLQLEMISPEKVVEKAIDRLSEQAKRAEIRIKWECEKELPLILADAPRIEQVFVNLIHNAIKFTEKKGEIKITAKKKKKFVIFSVEDSGRGIPAKDIPRIFERFYKSDRARAEGGTGLGLAIARHVVEGHQGRIWVESEEGRGSRFYFEIPIAV